MQQAAASKLEALLFKETGTQNSLQEKMDNWHMFGN
jgi:hypothetical protein